MSYRERRHNGTVRNENQAQRHRENKASLYPTQRRAESTHPSKQKTRRPGTPQRPHNKEKPNPRTHTHTMQQAARTRPARARRAQARKRAVHTTREHQPPHKPRSPRIPRARRQRQQREPPPQPNRQARAQPTAEAGAHAARELRPDPKPQLAMRVSMGVCRDASRERSPCE